MKKYLCIIFVFVLIFYFIEIGFGYLKNRGPKHGNLYQILSTGQSLSVGASGKPTLTIVQPFENKMLDKNNKKLIPLVEPSTTIGNEGGETMGSALANSLSFKNGENFQTVVTNHGYGGYAYDKLNKGTEPYEKGLQQLKAVHENANRLGKNHEVIGVTVIHGEDDQIGIWNEREKWYAKGYSNLAEVYKDFLVQWQRDYENDVKRVTRQESVPLYIDQMSSHTGAGSSFPVSALGQLKAVEENPGKIILVGPKYFLDYADNFHLKNYSYRLLGEYYGKVIDQVFNKKKNWLPLMPTLITRQENIIYVKFHIPELASKLEFDTKNVDAMPNMGFEYSDTSGNVVINNVEIIANDTVKIVLNKIPDAAAIKTLNYAYTGMPGANPGAHSDGSAKGNLRDDDPSVSMYDSNIHLYNWAVHFSKNVE